MGSGEGSGQGFGSGCLKCILILLNIIFGLIGTVLLGIGIFIYAGLDKILNENFGDQLGSITKYMEGLNLKDYTTLPEGSTINFAELVGTLAIPFIILGALLFITSFFGCCGACCSSKVLLLIYIIVCSVLLLVQVILVALFFSGKLAPTIRSNLQGKINSDYKGIDSFGVWSLAMNFLMTKFSCCGLDSYTDFDTAANWRKQRTFEAVISGHTVEKNVTLVTPMACCKFAGTFPSLGEPVDKECAWQPNDLSNNWKTGCWGEVSKEINQHKTTALGALIGVLLAQVAVIVIVIILLCLMDKDKIGVV